MSSRPRRYWRPLAAVAVALPCATVVLPAQPAAAAYPASAITVTAGVPNVMPGARSEIWLNLEVPNGVDPGPVGLSVPLTGLPDGFEVTTISGVSSSCHIDHQDRRAWCTNLTFLTPDTSELGFVSPGSSWVTLGLQVAAGLSRDVDWSGVPVTVSTATESAVSSFDLATTRLQKPELTLDKVGTELSFDTSGTRQTIRGSLYGPQGRRPIVLEMKPVRSAVWQRIARVETDRNGNFVYEYPQRINGVVRARFEGDSAFTPGSAETSLPRIMAGLTGWVERGSSKRGKAVTLTPTVVPSRRKVLLQWRTEASPEWKTVQTVESPADGRIKLTWTPKTKGKYWLRAYLTGDQKAARSWDVRVQQVS